MRQKLLKALEQMKQTTMTYANQVHFIKDIIVDQENEKFTIKTNLSEFTRKFESGLEFLRYWTLPQKVVVNSGAEDETNSQIAVFVESESSLMGDLIDTLKDNIKKVKEDKNYIPQATSINNNVNTIVNITKMKLSLFNQMKRTRK